jgi:hypothetical protein
MIHLLLLPLLAASPQLAGPPAASSPAVAAAQATAALPAANPASPAFSPAGSPSTPFDRRVNLQTPMCPIGCTSVNRCNPQVLTVTFLHQNADGECVYLCQEHQDCVQQQCDNNCGCSCTPYSIDNQFRGRVGPYPPDHCPAPDNSFCGF